MRPGILTVLLLNLTACLGGNEGNGGGQNTRPAPDLTPEVWRLTLPGHYSLCSHASENYVSEVVYLGDQVQRSRVALVDLNTHAVVWQSKEYPALGPECQEIITSEGYWVVNINGGGISNGGGRTLIYNQTGLLAEIPLPQGHLNGSGRLGVRPIIRNQLLYVVSETETSNYLQAYDISNLSQPKRIWIVEFPPAIWATEVDNEGVLYISHGQQKDNLISALDSQTGQTLWTADTAIPRIDIWATALRVENNLLLAAVFDSIVAFDRKTGKRIWVSPGALPYCPDGGNYPQFLEVGGGRVYGTYSAGICVFAFNLSDGSLAWINDLKSYRLGASFGGRPKYLRGVLYAHNSLLWGFDAASGKILSISTNADPSTYNPVLYSPELDQLVVWGEKLRAFKPLK